MSDRPEISKFVLCLATEPYEISLNDGGKILVTISIVCKLVMVPTG